MSERARAHAGPVISGTVTREAAGPERPSAAEELQQLLRSEEPLDRFGALIDLRDLIEGGDARIADAATQALRKLTTDDSRRVAAAAQRLLAEETARAAAIAAGEAVSVSPIAGPSPPPEVSPERGPESTVPIDADASATSADSASIAPSPEPEPAARPASVPWSLGRTAARMAIGSIAGMVAAAAWYAVFSALNDSPVDPEEYIPRVIGMGAAIMFISVAIVTVAESQVPALRLPDGDVYRIVGGNRFAAAAVLGAIVALTVGVFEYVISDRMGAYGLEVAFCFAVGFVLAEAVVGHRFTGSPKEGVPIP